MDGCCYSVTKSCLTPEAFQASLSFTISQSLLKLMSTELVMPSNHLILCWPLLLLPSIFPSTCVFSKESALHIRWPESWGFSLGISPSDDYSRLISFRIDWFDLLDGLVVTVPSNAHRARGKQMLSKMWGLRGRL